MEFKSMPHGRFSIDLRCVISFFCVVYAIFSTNLYAEVVERQGGFQLITLNNPSALIKKVISNFNNPSSISLASEHLDEDVKKLFIFLNQKKIIKNSIFYVNTNNDLPDTNSLHNILTRGGIVLLDSSEASLSQNEQMVLNLTGISVKGTFVIIYEKLGTYEIFPLIMDDILSFQDVNNDDDSERFYNFLVDATQGYNLKNTKHAMPKVQQAMPNNRIYSIHMQRKNLPCLLKEGLESDHLRDYCDRNASIDLNYIVELFQVTTPYFADDGIIEAGKYVRFSISSDFGPGAGIHLSDKLEEENYIYHSVSNRSVRMGPFASSYKFSIIPESNGMLPIIHKSSPRNLDMNFYKEQVNFFYTSQLADKITSQGDRLNYGIIAYYLSERKMIWDTKEYIVVNGSSGSNFSVAWTRHKFDCRDSINGSCSFVGTLMDDGKLFGQLKFSSISYARFSPNFDVIYRVPEQYADNLTDFLFCVDVEVRVRFGSVIPILLVNKFEIDGYDSIHLTGKEVVKINWQHPFFNLEPPVRIRSLDHSNACLQQVDLSGDKFVTTQPCAYDIKQGWSVDHLSRYRSNGYPEYCLSKDLSNHLILENCSDSENQRWLWDNQHLIPSSDPSIHLHLISTEGERFKPDTNNQQIPLQLKSSTSDKTSKAYGHWRVELLNLE